MKIRMNIEDLTLRGQLAKLKYGYGNDTGWVSLSDKELKEDFFKTLNYYKENEKKLNKEEKEYLEMLEQVKLKVYSNKEMTK